MTQYFDKKYILFYFILALLFRYIFLLIPPLFITNLAETPVVIDAALMENFQLFNTRYVLDAKPNYDHVGYWQIYFPLDTVFPVVYSLFFISIADLIRNKRRLFKWLSIMILAGAIFDWIENLLIGIYVSSISNALAPAVSFFTSIKSILFAINIVDSILILIVSGYRILFFSNRR